MNVRFTIVYNIVMKLYFYIIILFYLDLYDSFGADNSKSTAKCLSLTFNAPYLFTAIIALSSVLNSTYPKPFNCCVCCQIAKRIPVITPHT